MTTRLKTPMIVGQEPRYQASPGEREFVIENLGGDPSASDGQLYELLRSALDEERVILTVETDQDGRLLPWGHRLKMNDQERKAERLKQFIRDTVAEQANQSRPRTKGMFSVLTSNVDVKPESEKYSGTRRYLKHATTGYQLMVNDRPVEEPSERDLAKAGAWFRKWALRNGFTGRPLNEHENNLLAETANEDLWCGPDPRGHEGWCDGRKLADYEVKALLDDSPSGGSGLIPVQFDYAIITYPLLYGQLYPYVNIQEVQGDHILLPSIKNPTVTWSNVEGTAATLFDTTSLVSQVSTTFYPVSIYIEVGRNLVSDSGVDIMQILQQISGAAYSKELDRVIALGDGTTQPQGIFNASGTTSISSVNSIMGPLTLGDAEDLYFSLPKQYRDANFRPMFVSGDNTYRRFRAIPIGMEDARRVFGEDESDYMLMGMPYKISNDINDQYVAFGCMAKYRLYRRLGQEVRVTDQGMTLFKTNTQLLAIRGRFGGRVVDGAAWSVMTNAPTFDS